MKNNLQTNNNEEARDILEKFIGHWLYILICLIIAISIGFIYLRYADNAYSATATIKIQDEKEANKLPSLEDISGAGLFKSSADDIIDEIEVIKSRTLIENVVNNLNLNVKCFVKGQIKEQEIYKNPPIKILFFDSIPLINKRKGAIFVKVKSPSEFILFNDTSSSIMSERDESQGSIHSFGERIKSPIGDITLTPNIEDNAPNIGSLYKITLSTLSSVISYYQRAIEISTTKNSRILKLGLKDSDPKKAIDVLNELIKQYDQDILKDKEQVVKVTSDFINKRLEQLSEELGEVETNAELIEKQNSLVALNSQADINLQTKKQLENQIATTATDIEMISYLEEEINDENKISDMLPANIGIGDGNTAVIIKSHNELVAQRDKLLKNSSEKNPVVVQLNNQIKGLKQNLQNSLATIKKTSQLTLNNLQNESNRVKGQLYVAPSKARTLRGIQRQQSIKESLYLYLLEKREESAIRLGMYTSTAKRIDSAYSSYMPVAPNVMFVYLACILFGLGIPIGFIYIYNMLDTKVHSKKDVLQILEIPYLGEIPKTSKKQKLIKKVDYSPKAEAFRILRSNIDFLLKDLTKDQKRLFVTSTKAQEGKSHTSTNLASSISFSEKSVLLIEMDIRVPKILDYLGVKEKPNIGLTDYIADKTIKPQEIVVKHPDNDFLDIIPSGTIPPNPSELLMSERVTQLFKHFENKYEYIVADTSAVGLVSDTLLISHFADLFIYVVSADNVDKRKLANLAQPLYDNNRLPKMTLLLNGVKSGKKGYGYGYGYGNNPTKKKKWFNFSS